MKGSKLLTDPKSAHWANKTLEIAHGYGKNFELGFYTFTGIAPGGDYQYPGNQVRIPVFFLGLHKTPISVYSKYYWEEE